jgi:poly-gamma-glutamate capsule biosynthesis protein CapA/YwtB (metallophosphatase superfamily)
LTAFVPVTNVYATRQSLGKAELASMTVYVPGDTDDKTSAALASALGLESSSLSKLTSSVEDVADTAVAFVPADQLSPNVKLLTFEGGYYLDSFIKGAVFRQATFEGEGATSLNSLVLNSYKTKDATLKINMTGVTALTRVMMKKLATVGDPKYFSKNIGAFLADADITHVSNEVSFKAGCTYHNAVFCAPPEMIEVLKDSGVDLVELTGNHNNDTGRQYNTETINLYHSLGWHTIGGGLNTAEAAKPYVADLKGSKVAFLAYNYPDAPNGGAIATASGAGANPYTASKVKSDVAAARQQGASFVIADIQFWECYSYPDGYVEFPECDRPIADQKEVFRQMADAGADMVIGSSAHQPQTYEIYKGKPIYYGLGNLYFEQTSWPGTERGIILTHYFVGSKLVQTKLSPTVYHTELQTRLMDDAEAVKLLKRLDTARQAALE